jgi:hypothetical protein
MKTTRMRRILSKTARVLRTTVLVKMEAMRKMRGKPTVIMKTLTNQPMLKLLTMPTMRVMNLKTSASLPTPWPPSSPVTSNASE